MSVDLDLPQTIYPNLLANPCVIPNLEMPRVLDINPWFDHDPCADLSTKHTKQRTFKAREWKWCEEERGVDQIPKRALDRVSRVVPGIVKGR